MNIIITCTRLTMATTAGNKRKREVLTPKVKRNILDRLEQGVKPSSIMQKFNCGKSTISDIKKNKERILSYISTMEIAKRRKALKKESYEDVEKATYL